MLTFQCPHCQGSFEFTPGHRQTTTACPHCQQSVPLAANQPPEARLQSHCSVCHGLVSKNAFECPHCGDEKNSRIPGIFNIIAIIWTLIGIAILIGLGLTILGISLNPGSHSRY